VKRLRSRGGQRLPDLAVAESDSGEALGPGDAEGVVRTWLGNPESELFAYEAAGRNWIHVAKTATFRFNADGLRVDAFLERGLSLGDIRDVYERSVLPLVLQASGLEVLHASAVFDGGDLIALAGVSRSGKSTVARALEQRGLDLWADDAVAFSVDRDGARSLPLPFSPRLRATAVAHLDSSRPKRVAPQGETAPIKAVVLLRPDSSCAHVVELERLRSVEAFPALLPHAYCFSIEHAERNRRMIDEYLRLVEKVPIWCLRFRPSLGHLSQMLDGIGALEVQARRDDHI
jgi:hypothetical protein